MSDPLQRLLQQVGLRTTPFAPNSRYYTTETATYTPDVPNGNVPAEPVTYLRRRFVPAADRFTSLQEHIVAGGERPDTLANQYLGDHERFWQLCDANTIVAPNDLTDTIGQVVRITLPEGL